MKFLSKKRSKRVRIFARFLLYSILLGVIGLFIGLKSLEHAWPEQKLKPFLEKEFSHFLNRKLTIEKVDWGFRPSPVLIGRNVQLWENESNEMAFGPQVNMFISLASLLHGRIEFEEIEFIETQATFRLRPDRTADLFDMIKEIRSDLKMKLEMPGGKPLPYFFHQFSIVNSRFFFIDEKIKPNPLKTTFLVTASGEIKGAPKKRRFPFVLSAQIDSQESGFLLPVRNLVKNIRGFVFKKSGFVKLQGELGKDPHISIHSDDFPLGAFSEHMTSLSHWTGSVSVNAQIKKRSSQWHFSAKGESVNLSPKENLPWPQLRLNYDFQSNGESFISAEMTDPVMDAAMNISLPSPREKQINVALASTELNVKNLVEYWKTARLFWQNPEDQQAVAASSTTALVQPGWGVQFSARAQRIIFRDEAFENMELDARRNAEGSIFINALNVGGLGGDLTAKGAFEVQKSTAFFLGIIPPHFSTEWNLSHVDLMKTMRVVGLPPLISGIGETQGRLSGNFNDVSGRETQGEITLNLSSGVVSGVPGLVKTFTRLNIRSLIKKESSREREGLPFQTAAASIVIKDGVASFEPAALFTNETLQVAFLGSIDLDKETVKGNVVIHFVTFISEIIGAIPGIRTILMGDQKSIVPLWIDINGPLQDPDINVRQSKWITAPLWNTVNRLFRLPSDFIKSISGQKKE